MNAYPLQWPQGWKRTPADKRVLGKFARRGTPRNGSSWKPLEDVTLFQSVGRLLEELNRMGIPRDDVVISTNVPTRLDGLPRSDAREPADPGAAVYWDDCGNRRCMAIDQYTKVAQNVAALAATIEAMRAIERHGGAMILERAFTGFAALPAPGQGVKRDWWVVLEVDPATVTREGVKQAYRRLASQYHPDRPGGSHDAMAELNAAQDKGLLEVFR